MEEIYDTPAEWLAESEREPTPGINWNINDE
jgi:hypothetical protein